MKTKHKKLIFQVSIVILPVFIFMIAAVTYAMYHSTVNGFLDAQGSHMEYLLSNDLDLTKWFDIDALDWYLDRWETEPEKMRIEIDGEFEETYSDYYEDDDSLSRSWLERIPEELKTYCANLQYYNLDAWNGNSFIENNYDYLFCIDLSEKYRGMVFFEYSKERDPKPVGEYYDFKLKDHPVIDKMIKDSSGEIVFEKTKNFPEKGSYYIGYLPVIIDGEVRAAVGIVYNWEHFQKAMMTSLKKALVISIGAMIVALMLLQLVLYRKTISPVSRIQKSVCDYIDTKDSETVVSRMSEITEKNEFGLLSDNISELAKEIDRFTEENIRLAGEKERVAAELDMATKIQAEQLPSTFPAFPDRHEFDIYASMTPAKEVGGDFYDYFFIDDDHLALVIADVSGKGVPAALFMMMSKNLINIYATMGLSPHEVLERTNEAICKNNEQKMFVTVWFGILEISTGKIKASNAGHEYPIIKQPDGEFKLLKDKHGFVLGGIKGKKYTEYTMTLEKGGTLFVYTDGVPESTNLEEKMFGTTLLVDTLNKNPDAPPKELLENVHDAVNDFVGDASQFDDLTMLAIKLI